MSIYGCGTWDNFTTYFNLYYNTASIFEDAEKEILNQKRDLFSNDPLVVPSNAKNGLIKVVEKASKLLQFNANSSFVDESLMMLGKSFYYQGNFQKGKRKFQELLATDTDDTEQILEANLWIAKSDFEMRSNSDALALLKEVRTKAVEEDIASIIKETYVQEIKYRLREKEYGVAIALTNEFLEVYDDDDVKAEVYYALADLYTITGDKEKAITAYENVFEYSPDFDLEISASIKYAKALRDAGQVDKALEVFEDMRTEDKFSTSFNEIDLEIGKTQAGLQNYQKANEQFRIVDSLYKNTPFASAASFELAEIYRFHIMDYDSATKYYSKSLSSNPPKEYVEKVRDGSQLFNKCSKIRKEINKFDRQLFYSENPHIFSADSSVYVEDSLIILSDYLSKKELQDIWSNVGTPAVKIDTSKSIDLVLLKHSFIVKDSINKVDSLIRLGMYDPADSIGLRQSIRKSLVDTFIKDSLHTVDSLVRVGKINPIDTAGLKLKLQNTIVEKTTNPFGQIDDGRNKLNQLLQNQSQVKLDTVKFKRNPPLKLKISIDSAKTVLAKNKLELGNLFLTELNVPDSAYALYAESLERFPSTIYYPNTLYALGSYYLTINEQTKADSLFRIIYDNYKDRKIVNAAANKINLPLIDLEYDPANDEYAAAEDLMLNKDYNSSVSRFFNIYKDYPKSSLAPQALYTSGWILENDLLLLDSAAAVYDTLITKYPASVYVKNVGKKVTTYKQEKARRQKAILDSLNMIKQQQADSLLAANTKIDDNGDTLKLIEDENPENTGMQMEEDEDLKQIVKEDKVIDQHKKVEQVSKRKLEPLWDPRKHRQ